MKFNHLFQAIQYAKETGDIEALNQYQAEKVGKASKAVLPVLDKNTSGDDVLFLMALMSALVDVNLAAMTPPERAAVNEIKSQLHLTVVKAVIPGNM